MRCNPALKLLIRSESTNELQSRNSFGLIRLGLAVVVVFHHSLVLTSHDALSFIGRSKDIDIGTIGVAGFFAISGFLLLASSRRLNARKFLTHRFFRLFPGLWACLIVTAFILVPFANYFSKFESSMYFFKLENSSFSYVVFNSALLVLQDSIGTVFEQNPYPIAVNGSLWTLAPEFICYIGLLIVATFSRRNRKLQFVLISLALILSSVAWQYSQESQIEFLSQILNPLSGLVIAFCTGSLFAIFIEIKPFRPRLLPIVFGLVVWVVAGVNSPVSIIVISLLLISLGMSLDGPRVTRIGKKVDLSYGVYLYHFPIIQTVLATTMISWTPLLAFTVLPFFTLLISGLIAFASWTFVERPSMAFARAGKVKKQNRST